MSTFTDSMVEEAALTWLEAAGWQIARGPDVAPDMPAAPPYECEDGALADVPMPEPREAR